jgi:hypothetical protein
MSDFVIKSVNKNTGDEIVLETCEAAIIDSLVMFAELRHDIISEADWNAYDSDVYKFSDAVAHLSGALNDEKLATIVDARSAVLKKWDAGENFEAFWNETTMQVNVKIDGETYLLDDPEIPEWIKLAIGETEHETHILARQKFFDEARALLPPKTNVDSLISVIQINATINLVMKMAEEIAEDHPIMAIASVALIDSLMAEKRAAVLSLTPYAATIWENFDYDVLTSMVYAKFPDMAAMDAERKPTVDRWLRDNPDFATKWKEFVNGK